MTDREIVVRRLKRLIKAAHNDTRDFIYITVGSANVIIRLLEEQEWPEERKVSECQTNRDC